MGYTNFIQDPNKKPSSLEKLDWMIEDALSQGKEVYILAMSNENFRNVGEAIKTYEGLTGVHGAICVNGTIDLVIAGDEHDARRIARSLHEKTGERVAIIRYNGTAHTYLDIREALDVTKQKGEPWHVYNPDTESIDALIKN